MTLVLVCLMAVSMTAFAADDAKVTVNGQSIKLDQPPVIRDGRVFIPLRAVGEALLCKVDWESETQTAMVNSGYVQGDCRYAIVKKDGKYGAVDMNNKALVNFSYTLENIDTLRTKAETTLNRKGIKIPEADTYGREWR